MFKKIAAVAIVLALVFSLAACGSGAKIVKPEKKVAVLVAPRAQYPEDYDAAMALQKKYSDNIVVKEYADSRILKAGDAEIITLSKELAGDADIGAIIYARATQFTSYAIYSAKAINPDIVTVAIEPEEKLSYVAACADVIIACDWEQAANDIVASAKEMGADSFFFMSIRRHLESELTSAQEGFFSAACEKNGIKYDAVNGFDPIGAEGIAKSQLVVREQIAQAIMNKRIGEEKAALFSTDSSVQSVLAENAESRNMIYFVSNFPTAFNGIIDWCGLEIPENIKALKKAVSGALKDKESGTFGMYNGTLMTSFVYGAAYIAFDLLNGTYAQGDEGFAESINSRLAQAADSKTFSSKGNEEFANVFYGYDACGYSQF